MASGNDICAAMCPADTTLKQCAASVENLIAICLRAKEKLVKQTRQLLQCARFYLNEVLLLWSCRRCHRLCQPSVKSITYLPRCELPYRLSMLCILTRSLLDLQHAIEFTLVTDVARRVRMERAHWILRVIITCLAEYGAIRMDKKQVLGRSHWPSELSFACLRERPYTPE